MCRWLAYSGKPIPLEEMILLPENSLIDQSMSAKMSPNPTNGDGFGLGWYNSKGEPGVYRGVQPAWNDPNLRDLAHHLESPMFLAHVRRSTGTPVQQSNCHPFRHGSWLFVHNGLIYGYEEIRRSMLLEIDASLFSEIRGSTDSELMFLLALTYGLEDDPIGAMERMVGMVERLGKQAGIPHPMQMTVGVTEGKTLYCVRYSTTNDSRTLFYSTDISALRDLYPDEDLSIYSDASRLITSEPVDELSQTWNPVPESCSIIVHDEDIELTPFKPREP